MPERPRSQGGNIPAGAGHGADVESPQRPLPWGEMLARRSAKDVHHMARPFVPVRQHAIDAQIDRVLENTEAQWTRHSLEAHVPDPRTLPTSCSAELHAAARGGPRGLLVRGSASDRPAALPWRAPEGTDQCEAAAYAYLNAAAQRRRLPMMPKCLVCPDDQDTHAKEAIAIDIGHFNLVDDEAVPLIRGLERHDTAFSSLLLPGNPRLGDLAHLSLLRLVCARSVSTGVRIQHLDLSDARGLGQYSLELLTREFQRELRHLRSLQMSGVAVAESAWPAMEQSVQGLVRVEELGLSGMQIGRASQKSAVSAAGVLLGLPELTKLDLSNNFFGHEGCQALAENLASNTSLRELDLSHNAGGFTAASCAGFIPGGAGHRGSSGAGAGASTHLAFNPMSLVCEGMMHARGLSVLSLVRCQLSCDEDFVLEDAIREKAGRAMEVLNLSENPCQGPLGVRCLMRLVVQQGCVGQLEIGEIRDSVRPKRSQSYEHSNPSAQYDDLDLGYPQHRALLRALLRRCRDTGSRPEDLLKFRDQGLGARILSMWRAGQGMPASGPVSFTFQLPPATDGATADIAGLIQSIDVARKHRVSLLAFVRMAHVFRRLVDDESRRIFLSVMSSDMLLKLSYVKYLSELDCRMRAEVIERLLPAVHSIDRAGAFRLVLNARSPTAPPLHITCASMLGMLLFNASCPTGHYGLNLLVPADRRVLEMIMIVNDWERARAKAGRRPDLSQHSGHECIRNALFNDAEMVYRSKEFSMPPRGDIVFDYCSLPHLPASTEPTSDAILDKIELSLRSSLCDPKPRIAALRTVLHKFHLRPEQCGRLIAMFHPADFEASSFSPRVEMFVATYPQCVDIGGLLSSEDHGLYGAALFAREEICMIRQRLGRFRTWDLTRCDEEELRRSNLSSRGGTKKETMELAKKDAGEMRQVLRDHGIRDDPTSRGNANRYEFDLTVFEDWQCVRALLKLAQSEQGDHFDEPMWSGAIGLADRGAKWLVPQEWNAELPKTGMLELRYIVQRQQYKDQAARRRLAEEYLGW